MAKTQPSKRYCYDFPMPTVTTDVVLMTVTPEGARVLLIERAAEPMKGSWALPGGFVNPQEPLDQGACRELLEETSVAIAPAQLRQFGAYGDPGRDPRGWTISIAFFALVQAGSKKPAASDDAKKVAWKPLHRPPKLAFDHRRILKDAVACLKADLVRLSTLKPLFGDEPFPLHQLVETIAALTNQSDLDAIRKNVQRSDQLVRVSQSRPPLYRFA